MPISPPLLGYQGLPEEEPDPYLAELEALQNEEFQPGQFKGGGSELFAGLENQQFRQPQSFSEGLLYGLTSGLGSAGSRVATARQKFEQSEQERRRIFDEGRRRASSELRSLSGQDRRLRIADRLRTKREEEKTQKDYERDFVVPSAAQLKAAPWISRVTGPDGRVSRKVIEDAMKPVETKTEKEPIVAIDTPEGPRYVPRSQAIGRAPAVGQPKGARVTGADRQALAYFNRAKQSVETMTTPMGRGRSLEDLLGTNAVSQAKIAAARDAGPIGMAAQASLSPAERSYLQAQRAFTEARLRKESGAAIPPHEYEADARTYFAQPGDDPRAIAQKRAARDVVLQGLGYAAGPAYEEFYGEPFPESARVAPGAAQTRTANQPNVAPRKFTKQQVDDAYAEYLRSQR